MENRIALQTNSVNTKQPLIVALYARVSTGRQENEATIESQIEEIKQKILSDKNILPPENIFIDDGWTGEIIQRPNLDKLRDAVQANSFQILYVYDRGRIARKFAYQELVIEELEDKNIEFVTLHDVKATTPEEHVLQAMQGVFHEYERVKIVERMRRGKMFKAKSGILINGSALYGYNYYKKTETTPAHYEINEDEARIVRMIYKWVGTEGVSLRGVIKNLFDLHIPPRKGKSEFWTKGPIVRMLKNEVYSKGVIYYNKSQAVVAKNPIKKEKYKKIKRTSRKLRPKEEWIAYKVPTIIPNDGTFEKVREILKMNQKYAKKNRKYNYLLSGKTWCECGNRRAGDGYSKGGNHYYRCAERIYKFPIEKHCKSPGISAIALDIAFWKELVKFLSSPDLIRKQAGEWLKTQALSSTNNFEKTKLQESINKIVEEEKRYGRAYGEKLLKFEQFQELIKDAEKRMLSLQVQLKELNSQTEQNNIEGFSLDELIKEAIKVIKSFDLNNKIQIIRDIIDRVIIRAGREVEVFGHIPITALNMGYETISRNCWITQCRKIYPI